MRAVSDLSRTVRQFVSRLLDEFSADIEKDPSRFKHQVVQLLKAELPPGPGRPRGAGISRAAEMREEGRAWREVYAECLVDKSGGPESRQVIQSRLRSAVRARRNSRKHFTRSAATH